MGLIPKKKKDHCPKKTSVCPQFLWLVLVKQWSSTHILMVYSIIAPYSTHLWWFWGWFIIALSTLMVNINRLILSYYCKIYHCLPTNSVYIIHIDLPGIAVKYTIIIDYTPTVQKVTSWQSCCVESNFCNKTLEELVTSAVFMAFRHVTKWRPWQMADRSAHLSMYIYIIQNVY